MARDSLNDHDSFNDHGEPVRVLGLISGTSFDAIEVAAADLTVDGARAATTPTARARRPAPCTGAAGPRVLGSVVPGADGRFPVPASPPVSPRRLRVLAPS